MSRSQTQIVLILVYGFTGTLAFLVPGMTADLFAVPDPDQTSSALFLVRAFGASQSLIALLLFFFIVSHSASRRLMVTLSAYEGLILGAALLSLGPGNLATRTATIAVSLSALLALINLWGAIFARESGDEEEGGG